MTTLAVREPDRIFSTAVRKTSEYSLHLRLDASLRQ
jgi:hypothetical protein